MKKYVVLGGILLSLMFTLPVSAIEEDAVSSTLPLVAEVIIQVTTTTDSISPIITINGENPTTTFIGDIYIDPGSVATDDIDGDITEKIIIDNQINTNTTGTFYVVYTVSDLAGNTTTAQRVVSVESQPIIAPTTTAETSTTTLNNTPTTTLDNIPTTTPIIDLGSSGNATQPNFFTTDQIHQTANRINDYLKSQQSTDGKIEDGTATDWAIMSLGATGQYASDIKNTTTSLLNYEENYELNDPKTINICAGYPRHILAFLAAGIDTNHSAITNLRTKIITECYKNNTYGEYGINDDAFALFALLSTGSNINDEIIIDIINTIKADQTNDGAFTFAGWAGADMTGVAINALKYAQNNGATIDPQIFTHAKQYLKSNQLTDGGWGYGTSDVLTTSWAMMGINALSETQSDWINSVGKNPWNILIDNNKTDGTYESTWVPGTTDWFALQNAVPALLGKTWPIILTAKPQQFNYSAGSGCSNCYLIVETVIPTSTPTTTIAIVTTTIQITTTTPVTIIPLTTSTIEIKEIISTSTLKISATKKLLPKKILKRIPKIMEKNIISTNTSSPEVLPKEIKKTNFAQVISSSKNGLFYLGHQLLKLLRNVL